MTAAIRIIIVTFTTTLLAVGCGSGGSGGAGEPAPRSDTAALARVGDCDELADFVRTDARDKIAVQADQLRGSGWTWAAEHRAPDFTATPAAQATPAATAAGPGNGTGGGSHHFTDTNTQVPGIDEPDVVETDGKRLY